MADLITDRGAGASASGSCDEHARSEDAADDGGGDLLLEFTSECELEVDATGVERALAPVGAGTALAPLSVRAIVVTAPAVPPVIVRSRLTTGWQMQAARTGVVVRRRRTWTIPRPWQSAVESGFSRTLAFSPSQLALPILPFVYGVIFGGVTVLLATGQLQERTAASSDSVRPSSAQSSTARVMDTGPSTSAPIRQGSEGQAPRSAPDSTSIRQRDGKRAPGSPPATRPVRLERGTTGVEPNEDRVVFRGSLGLDSRPQGARVFVNGLDVGRTPIDLRNLAVGSRAVRLELTGYQPWSSVIRVVTDQRSRVTADLLPAQPQQPVTSNGSALNPSPLALDETGIP